MSAAGLDFRPFADRVLVRPKPDDGGETMTPGGLHIPATAKEKPAEGTVVAAGPGRYSDAGELVPMEAEVGMKVLYGKYSGTKIEVDGEEYLIFRDADLMGRLVGD